ncbi:MAG: alpha-glucosidase [Treponema sp.]|nr:alpha-glucosidase [Treponema sp.]
MIKRFVFGSPLDTEAVIEKPEVSLSHIPYFSQKNRSFLFSMNDDDIVYGLGENVRGINKRGYIYESFCTDEFEHNEETTTLYGAHNFFVVSGKTHCFGAFFDSPSRVTFDIGYTDYSTLCVTLENPDFEVYIIEETDAYSVVRAFRKIIGIPYIPPKWAFGAGQSRWGYSTKKDILHVADGYEKNEIPLDMIYMDIDYMNAFKDFSVDKKKFPNLKNTVEKLKARGIRLIPIIDAGIKKEDDDEIYEEGHKNGYFCTDEDGNDFVVGVWPGFCCFPDFLNKNARDWFGSKYKALTDAGIEGFWNDMNEPAIFYSEKRLKSTLSDLQHIEMGSLDVNKVWEIKDMVLGLANNKEDYKSFYHNFNGKKICHDTVHNLFGANMTRALYDFFKRETPEKQPLIFSRASCIGAHRYGGIWMGDNKSRWQHLLLNLKMLASLNMCGFLFTGADLGGFGANVTEDLLLRWYALGIFIPLLRNHSALGTREQEPYQFKNVSAFAAILRLRYRLLPYIYSEFTNAAEKNEMYGVPLGFLFPNDKDALHTEDQLFIGRSIMIAPVYEQNAIGRHIYLPEEMTLVRFKNAEVVEKTKVQKGHSYFYCPLDEVVIFLRKGSVLPLAAPAKNTTELDWENVEVVEG